MKLILPTGLSLLIHSGYSAIEHYSVARNSELPADIAFQALFSLTICIFGMVIEEEPFAEIHFDIASTTLSLRGTSFE